MRAAPLLLCLGLVVSSPLPRAAVGAEDAAGIQWFATWEQAKAEAKRSQRPILLISAAPHCRNVSGMW